MLSQKDADTCLEAAAVAAKLKQLSYAELEQFAKTHCMLNEWQSRELIIEGEKVDVNTMICKLGHLHKRISVELTLSAEPGILRPDTHCLYFERYKSGRFYPSPQEMARETSILKALPHAIFGGIVIGLLAFVWYLFL